LKKITRILRRLVILGLCFESLLFLSTNTYGEELKDHLTAKDLVHLTFEELMNVKVSIGTLTGIERSKLPLSLTTITKDDILSSPHRNLLDLLEVYVPGATYVNHWLGPRIGVRGVMSDRNHSYLLLVNGENLNLQASDGPVFEIQNKDISDIEKIEITRGPGSVIYGPGAIGGVISITTKNAKTADKAHIGVKRDFTYRYTTLNGSYSITKNDFSAYLFGSISKSRGIKDPKFYYIDRAHGYGYGYMSETWGNKGLGTPAPNFYADFQNRPEVKINLEIDFLKQFIFRARYTNFSFIKQQQKADALDGPAFPGLYGQQFTSSLINSHKFPENIELVSSIGFQSQSHGNIALYQRENKPFDDITQRQDSYSENKINLRSILSHTLNEKLILALGLEYNYWYYGPEWGKAKKSFVMDYPAPVKFAVLDTSSGFYTQYNPYGIVTYIDRTIAANQFSGFFEVNYQPINNTTLLVSGRLDKHNLAELAFSPRVALIQQLNKNNYLRLISQQSVRLPDFRELYAIDYASGNASAPEKLQGVELIYTHIQNQEITVNTSAFYQSVDQIAWIEEKSDLIGTFETAGIEADISYKSSNINIALSYSFINQLGWRPEKEINSYLSRIGLDSLDVHLVDAGENRINNFPQHQFKLLTNYSINKSLNIHFNGRIACGYGQLDMLNMFKAIHDEYGMDHTRNEMTAIYDDLQDKGYGKPSFTSNMSVNYKLPFKKVNLSMTAWAMNIIAFNNIRYVYQFWENGDSRQYPRQVGFVNEPLSFGLLLNVDI
jgi:outer membrane receptor for ferrienterochelin and colicin